MARIAPEAVEMFGIRTEVRNARLDHPERVFHQLGETRVPCRAGGASRTSLSPSSTRSLSFRPRIAASALARR
jgi:hypothetical protein